MIRAQKRDEQPMAGVWGFNRSRCVDDEQVACPEGVAAVLADHEVVRRARPVSVRAEMVAVDPVRVVGEQCRETRSIDRRIRCGLVTRRTANEGRVGHAGLQPRL